MSAAARRGRLNGLRGALPRPATRAVRCEGLPPRVYGRRKWTAAPLQPAARKTSRPGTTLLAVQAKGEVVRRGRDFEKLYDLVGGLQGG